MATTLDTSTAPVAREAEQVRLWRFEQLGRAGFPARDAFLLSGRSDVDLHVAAGLVRRGCPAETALRILL